MTDKLPQTVFNDLPPIALNQQIHVNHQKCPAGKDDRKRLYIKRVGPDAYVAHCFNCGGSGYKFSSRGTTHRVDDLEGHRKPVPNVIKGFSGSGFTDELPIHVQEYLLKYHVNPEEAVRVLGYKYSPSTDSLMMPLFQDNHLRTPQPDRGQLRWMSSESGVSRYTAFSRHTVTQPQFGLVSNFKSPEKTVVIVEDQISAYRVFRDSCCKMDAVALLGTSLPASAVECLSLRKPELVYVWLDDDAAGKAGAVKVRDTLRPVLPDATIINLQGQQPKDLSTEGLRGVLGSLRST